MKVTVEEVAAHATSEEGRAVIAEAVKSVPSFNYAVLSLLADLHPDKRLVVSQSNIQFVVNELENGSGDSLVIRARQAINVAINVAIHKALYHE